MCQRRSCIISCASVFTWLAFALAAVALFAPFWLTVEVLGKQLSKGIVMECFEPFSSDRDCDFIIEDTWESVKDADLDDFSNDNFLVTQITWIVGTGLLLLNAILGFLLCCDRCRTRCCSVLLTVLVFVAAACLAVSVIVFGVENEDRFDRGEPLYYDWGFHIAMAAAACGVLASLFLGCAVCVLRKDVD